MAVTLSDQGVELLRRLLSERDDVMVAWNEADRRRADAELDMDKASRRESEIRKELVGLLIDNGPTMVRRTTCPEDAR